MKKKFIILFIFLPVIAFSQDRISLIGNVFDGISFFPVAEANIYNFNTKKYNFTNKEGNFEIISKVGDTIIVSKPAYKQILIVVTQEMFDKKQDIALFYKAIVLKEVRVYALPATYSEFKKEFVSVNFSDITKLMESTSLREEDRMRKLSNNNLLDLIPGKVGQAIGHPISFLYDTFSRKAKMERLYQEMVENEKEAERLPQKYNRDLVTSITGLEGEDLLDFMTFCKFSYYDLVRWTPEFIVTQINKKFGDYEYYKALEDN